MMVGIVFAALAIAWMLGLTVAVLFQLVALTRAWFEMPATCSSAADNSDHWKEKCEEALRGRDLVSAISFGSYLCLSLQPKSAR
jgi:hypothetical protein